jgi:hypothetical protein
MLPSALNRKPVQSSRDSSLARALAAEPEWGIYHASDIYRFKA